MKFTIIATLFLASVLSIAAQPKEKVPPTKPVNPAFEKVNDNPKLPRVLLVGDSISIGYTAPVQNLLKEKANVHRIPENGGPTTNGVAKMKLWLGNGKWDVIHFNFGLHDLKLVEAGKRRLTPEEYEKYLREIVQQLKATKAKLIWANTTPVPGPAKKLARITDDVPVYNAVAAKIMDENKIVTDDLYSFALPQLSKIQIPENVHFTAEGYQVLAKKVAESIEAALAK
ncbi:MAG: SGNH/GDSL hydrolase family protein [Verrucomicrobiota bacterium]